MKVICLAGICLLGLSLFGCHASEDSDADALFRSVPVPAASPSGQPRLVSTDDGLLMSWVEIVDTVAELRYSFWRDERWTRPEIAARGADWFVNWADTPGVVPFDDGRLLAFYLQRTGPQPYAYGIRVTTGDGDGEWSEPIIPHQDGLPVEYGFISVVPQGDGSARMFWLDGTAMYAPGGDSGGHGGHGGPMALRTAVVTPDGVMRDASLLDHRTCECCPTAAVATRHGALVAYRGRSEEEVRDIAVVHVTDGEGEEPFIPQRDNWVIAGCPVNGPALVSDGDFIALSWFTGAEGGKVQTVLSEDGGRTFGAPIRLDDGGPTGRVAAALLENGDVLVSWLEAGEEGAELRLRRISGGEARATVSIADVPADRGTGMPKLAAHDGHIWAGWVDAEARTVRIARARIEAVP
jgi:hypothetical protein